jgi:uncharacterized membrane protein affecting hemolysin expression
LGSSGESKKQKQSLDVYTMMLVISFICVLTASLLLYFELERWGDYPWWRATGG